VGSGAIDPDPIGSDQAMTEAGGGGSIGSGGWVDVFVEERTGRNEIIIDICDDAKETAGKLTQMLIWSNPALVPCTSPPKPWTDWRQGGYQDERTRASVTFVKGKAARLDLRKFLNAVYSFS
jgi:DNA-directed RNA polymerase